MEKYNSFLFSREKLNDSNIETTDTVSRNTKTPVDKWGKAINREVTRS